MTNLYSVASLPLSPQVFTQSGVASWVSRTATRGIGPRPRVSCPFKSGFAPHAVTLKAARGSCGEDLLQQNLCTCVQRHKTRPNSFFVLTGRTTSESSQQTIRSSPPHRIQWLGSEHRISTSITGSTTACLTGERAARKRSSRGIRVRVYF